MTIINVNLDTATHVVAPRNPTDEMCDVMLITSGNFNKYCAAITEAPPFTSLPNDEHMSDCAKHNAPAYPPGECDCDVEKDKFSAWFLKAKGFPPTFGDVHVDDLFSAWKAATILPNPNPNPDLDLVERVIDMADGMSRFGSEEYDKIQEAIAALKRLKGDV